MSAKAKPEPATRVVWVATDRLARKQIFAHRRYAPGEEIRPEDYNRLTARQKNVLENNRFIEQQIRTVE